MRGHFRRECPSWREAEAQLKPVPARLEPAPGRPLTAREWELLTEGVHLQGPFAPSEGAPQASCLEGSRSHCRVMFQERPSWTWIGAEGNGATYAQQLSKAARRRLSGQRTAQDVAAMSVPFVGQLLAAAPVATEGEGCSQQDSSNSSASSSSGCTAPTQAAPATPQDEPVGESLDQELAGYW